MLECLDNTGATNYISYFSRLQFGVIPNNKYLTSVKLSQIIAYLSTIETEDCVTDFSCILEKLECK